MSWKRTNFNICQQTQHLLQDGRHFITSQCNGHKITISQNSKMILNTIINLEFVCGFSFLYIHSVGKVL